jgi:hypothetical protein
MEGQLLVGQLPVLLEKRATQHRLGRQPLPPGGLDAVANQVSRHQAKQIAMLVQPLRHRPQFVANLVRGEKIEYAGLDGAFLAFVETFVFRSARRHDPLLAALGLLRWLHQEGRRSLPDKVPVGHLKDKVRKVVFAGGKPDRRLYEVATFAVLRDRLRAGDVWVEGGRNYRPLDAHFISGSAFATRKSADDLGLGIPRDADQWLAEKQRELDFKLKQLAWRARTGKLPGVRLVDGVLIVSPQRSAVPKAAEAVKWLCLDRMPLIDIPDLIAEVDSWTDFAACFSHLRTGEAVRSLSALYAAILADATNLGPKRMAEASDGVSARQIAWARLFHLRHETFNTGVARIINAQLAHPYAQIWGAGTTSSSDGQFFRAAGSRAKRTDVNTH